MVTLFLFCRKSPRPGNRVAVLSPRSSTSLLRFYPIRTTAYVAAYSNKAYALFSSQRLHWNHIGLYDWKTLSSRLSKMAWLIGFPVNEVQSTSARLEDLCEINEGVVSKQTVVLRRWGSSIQKFVFINGVDNVNWPPYRDSKSWHFER